MKKRMAILGASYLQQPIILKAKEMGIETHVFAWKHDASAAGYADFFYDISIRDKDKILSICSNIEVDGIVSIATDAAVPTMSFISETLELNGNSTESAVLTTDKFLMRQTLKAAGIKCPNFILFNPETTLPEIDYLNYPLVVKPVDRSGSRGISLVKNRLKLKSALLTAIDQSFCSKAVVEEFVDGIEFSVESISFKGKHKVIAITEKVTSGKPHFVEIAHHQPADLTNDIEIRMTKLTLMALEALKIKNGISHTEMKLNSNNELIIIEVAGRMGGDFIGSTLTQLSTGIDMLRATIDISLSKKPVTTKSKSRNAGIVFLSKDTEWLLPFFEEELIEPKIVQKERFTGELKSLKSSSDRSGYIIYESNKREFQHGK